MFRWFFNDSLFRCLLISVTLSSQTRRSDKFGYQLDWKSKTWFFTFLTAYVSWIEWDKILISQLWPSKFRELAEQNGPKWTWLLTFSKYKNEYHKQLRAQKNLKKYAKRFIYIHLKNFIMLFHELCFTGSEQQFTRY